MACVLCSGDIHPHHRYDFKTAVFRSIYADPFIYRCARCGLRQANVARVDTAALTRYYQHDYRSVARIGTDTSAGESPYYSARGGALAALIPLDAAPKNAFELGSGYGYNLRALAQRFPGVALATDELDLTAARHLGAAKRTLDEGPYDVIILSHVVEHVTDPVSLVRLAQRSLAPAGYLIVEVPNDVEGIYTINGPDEPHLTFFTLESFKLLMERAGVLCTDIFVAGPHYRRKTLMNRLKRYVLASSQYLRPLRAVVDWRIRWSETKHSPAMRNPNGNVLRAVIRREMA